MEDKTIVHTKQIQNLDRVIETADGSRVRVDTGDDFTVRRALLNLLGSHKCSAVESFRIYELAIRLRSAGDELELSEADHLLVKTVVEAGGQQAFGGFILAQVYRAVIG